LNRTDQLKIIGKRSLGYTVTKIRSGDRLEDLKQILGQRQLEIPPMIDISGLTFRIMQGEVTVGLFRQFVDVGYAIPGHYGLDLLTQFKGAPENHLTHLSLFDGRALASALSDKTGKKWRVPTETEWEAAIKLVRNQLSGNDFEWTETPYLNSFILRSLNAMHQLISQPNSCYYHPAVRLVVDK
jgi:hypothetical protein